MAKSVAQFARDAQRFPDQLAKSTETAVSKSALLVTREIRSHIAKATGGDSRLSGVGKRGRKVGARYKVRPGANPSALVTAEGPLHLIERDTKPHRIPRERKTGRRRVVLTPWGPRASVQHPGTSGKEPFARGVRAATPRVPRVFQAEVGSAMRKTFGG